MTKTELQGKIAKMEKGLNNPNIQGDAKVALENALEKAKAQLQEMEEKTAIPKPIPERRQRTKVPAPDRVVPYSWKHKANLDKLQPIINHCQHYALQVKEEIQVGIKGKGSGTRKVDVLPGEWLIFDDKGFLVYVMDEGSFKAKCIYKTTVENHKKEKHKAEEVAKMEVEIEKLKVELEKEKAATQAAQEEKKKAEAATEKIKAESKEDKEKKQTSTKAASKPKAESKLKPKPKKAKPAKAQTAARKKKEATTKKTSAVEQIEKEINDVRTASKLPPNAEKFKKEFTELKEKGDQKSFERYVKARLKDGENLTKAEVIKLAIALRPLYQTLPGALIDVQSKNQKVLEPTYINLLRWAENPGRYDMQDVDIPKGAKATVKARKPKNPSVLSLFGL